MKNVKDHDFLPFLEDTVDRAIDMRLVAVQQVPELAGFGRHGAPVRVLFQAENGPLQASIPLDGRAGVLRVDLLVQRGKVPLGAGHDLNPISHAGLRIRQRNPWRDGLFPSLLLPDLAGFPQQRPFQPRDREAADKRRRSVRRFRAFLYE